MPTNLCPQGMTMTSSPAYPKVSDLTQHNQLSALEVPGGSKKSLGRGQEVGGGKKRPPLP